MAKRKKDTVDFTEMDVEELNRQLGKVQEELFKLRFRAASAPLKNTMQIRVLRRQAARLNTFIHQKKETR